MNYCIVMNVLNEEKSITDWLDYYLPFKIPILIWDSGSTDKTRQVVDLHESEYYNVKDWTPVIFFGKGFENLPDPTDFSQRKNYMHKVAKEQGYDWVIHVDCDERFDKALLNGLTYIIKQHPEIVAYKFPRINLSDPASYPDYQVRVLKLGVGIEWQRNPHEIPVIPREGNGFINLHDYIGTRIMQMLPILHLKRDLTKNRPWW